MDLRSAAAAREHARAQAGQQVATMRTVPARDAEDLPPGVQPSDLVWDETLGVGGYAAEVVARGTVLHLTDVAGDACLGLLAYRADNPNERLCLPDTVKVQWNAYLGAPRLLLSDMGRVLLSVTADQGARHDLLCGPSTPWSGGTRSSADASPGPDGAATGQPRSARECFLLALARHGLGRADLTANANLFAVVTVADDGALTFDEHGSRPGAHVTLRAEMDLLVVLANTPHVLDPEPAARQGPVRVLAHRGEPPAPDDACRAAGPEAQRAFENTAALHELGGTR